MSGYSDPFDSSRTEGSSPNGGMPPQFYNNLLAFGAATLAGANARTPQGFLANGNGALGPIGVGLQGAMANAAQGAQLRSNLAHTAAETQQLQGNTALQNMNLQFMKGRMNFMNQYMGAGQSGVPPLSSSDNSGAPTSGGPAPDKYATATPAPGPMADVVQQSASKYGVPLAIATWVGSHESGWNPNATNGQGANQVNGAWQFKAGTAQQYGVADPTDFAQSTDGAMRYLRDLAIKNNGDWGKVVDQYGTTSTGQGAAADNAVKQGFQQYLNRVGLSPQAAAGTPSQQGTPPAAVAASGGGSSSGMPSASPQTVADPGVPSPQTQQPSGFGPVTPGAPYQVAQAGNGPLPTPGRQPQAQTQGAPPPTSPLGSAFPPGMYNPQQALQAAQQADAMGDRAALGAMWGVPGADVEAQNQRQRAQQFRDFAQKFTLQQSAPQSIRGEGGGTTYIGSDGQRHVIQSPMVRTIIGPDNRGYNVTYNTIDTGEPYVRPPEVPSWAPPGTLSVTLDKLAPGEEKVQQDVGADAFGEKARSQYASASGTMRAMEDMDHQLDSLNAQGPSWYNTGEGATFRAAIGKSINGIAQSVGAPPVFDPDKLASGEDLSKQTKLAGMQVLSTFFGGSREAAGIVQSTQGAVPGIENTPVGAKLVLNGIKEASRWQMDQHAFMTNWYNAHAGNMVGADVGFNQTRPSAMYTRRGISMVRPYPVANPTEFKRYLPGTQVYLKGTDPKNPQNIKSVPGDEDITMPMPDQGAQPNGPG